MAPQNANLAKGHICPPSNASHPKDRWETMFVYSFICKFTQLRGKIEGLETPMDLENALLSHEPNNILTLILGNFLRNLRPHTRNLSTDQISTTLSSVLSEYFKSSERTVFWNDDLQMNVDPFEGLSGGFFATNWDFKLKIFRQLVELQLSHSVEIKETIDRAWGVAQSKHKKKDPASAPPDPSDPKSQERLHLIPFGQDSSRRRFWVVDDSPRIYTSTNPWKTTATFQAIASTKEEYITAIENLKASAPSDSTEREKRSKLEQAHLTLIGALEARVEAIDAEIARDQAPELRIFYHFFRRHLYPGAKFNFSALIEGAKGTEKIEQRNNLYALAEVRETRTRRQARRPDYVYDQGGESEDDADEYTYQEEEDYDDNFEDPTSINPSWASSSNGRHRSTERRRSSRNATSNENGKRTAPEAWSDWRGERRSSRLGAPPEIQLDVMPERKRARTEESTISTNSAEAPSVTASSSHQGDANGAKFKASGAAAVKSTEIALEQVAGRKKSKFWFYAVEPIPGAPVPVPAPGVSQDNGIKVNGDHHNGNATAAQKEHPPRNGNIMDYERSLEGSLSPPSSPEST